jgi:DNA-binding HxlR family transcriptional regulator
MEDGTSAAPGAGKVTEDWCLLADQPVGEQIRALLDRIGDKWSMLIIARLDGQTRRFMDLRRAVPEISQRMLTVTLRHLERDGLVERTVYSTMPVTVDYRLTTLGMTLLETVNALVRWTIEHEQQIAAAHSAYDARRREPVLLEPREQASRLSG